MIRRNRNLVWGIILILIALATLGIAFNLITGNIVKLIWAIILGGIAISNVISLSWGGVFFPLAVITHIYRDDIGIQFDSIIPVYIAALLLTFGFSMLTRGLKRRRRWGPKITINGKEHYSGTHVKDKVKESLGGFGSSYSESTDGESVAVENNFGDASKYINSVNLKNAIIENNFGNLRVYFDNTKFASEGTRIKVECNFGKVTVYLPRDINLTNNLTASLGVVTGEGQRINDDTVPNVILEGEATFGNIEVVLI